MSQIPEILTSFRVYNDGNDMIGVADVELPELSFLSEKIKGAGIAGEVETPIIGHMESLGIKLSFRVATEKIIGLAAPKVHHLDIRGSIQMHDAGAGRKTTKPIKVIAKVMPKKTSLGKLEPGAKMDASGEYEASYLKILLNGKKMVEIDKYNYICFIDGTDYLEDIRSDLGL